MTKESDTHRLTVHLVHGTWAYGFLKRPVPSKVRTWVDRSSDFRTQLEADTGLNLRFIVHRWPGRNSFRSRTDFAQKLHLRLRNLFNQNPSDSHVIIAHSHGGTACAYAVGWLCQNRYYKENIKALICLATPFTYSTVMTREERSRAIWSVCAITTMMLFMHIWLLCTIVQSYPILVLLAACVVSVSFGIPMIHYYPSMDDYHLWHIDQRVPVFLIRSPRDEASLLLGFVQFINFLSRKWYEIVDNLPTFSTFKSPSKLIMSFALQLPSLFIGNLIATYLVYYHSTIPLDDTERVKYIIIVTVIITPGIIGSVFFISQILTFLASGLYDFRRIINQIVEVEASPPGATCHVKSYSVDNDMTMSHSVHDSVAARIDIARIIRLVHDGDTPHF